MLGEVAEGGRAVELLGELLHDGDRGEVSIIIRAVGGGVEKTIGGGVAWRTAGWREVGDGAASGLFCK